MNFDLETGNLLDILSSHPWDSRMGRKILFLKRPYYLFDNMHKLLDGGGIRYNQTLDKIFIHNKGLRGGKDEGSGFSLIKTGWTH